MKATVRDILLDLLDSTTGHGLYGIEEAEEFVDAVLKGHAHELAEKQRSFHEEDFLGCSPKCPTRRTIDLIDPEVGDG